MDIVKLTRVMGECLIEMVKLPKIIVHVNVPNVKNLLVYTHKSSVIIVVIYICNRISYVARETYMRFHLMSL